MVAITNTTLPPITAPPAISNTAASTENSPIPASTTDSHGPATNLALSPAAKEVIDTDASHSAATTAPVPGNTQATTSQSFNKLSPSAKAAYLRKHPPHSPQTVNSAQSSSTIGDLPTSKKAGLL